MIKYLAVALMTAGIVVSAQASTATINWAAFDTAGVAILGGSSSGSTPAPINDLVEMGYWSTAPSAGSTYSAGIAGFTVIQAEYFNWDVGANDAGAGFFKASTNIVSTAAYAHDQIGVVAYNATTSGAATEAGIWYLNMSNNANWRVPANSDIPSSSTFDIETMFANPGVNVLPAPGSTIVFGGTPYFVQSDPNNFGGNTEWLPMANIIPEPSTIVMVGLGLLGMVGLMRRRS
jgi:hypothetical protein